MADRDDNPHGEAPKDEAMDASQRAYQDARPNEGDVPPIDFNTFVLSLSTSALIQLGEAPEGVPSQEEPSLAMARQTIDLLGILEDKTRGNLTGEEERLLSQVLFDLRMRYVAKNK